MCKNGWPARLMWLTRYILAWHARGSQIESHSCQRWFWGSFIRRKRQNSAGNVAFTVALKPMGRAIWGSKQSVPVAPQNGDSYPKRRKTLYKRNGWPLKALVKKICTILSSVPSWLHWNLQASISFGFAQIKWCLVHCWHLQFIPKTAWFINTWPTYKQPYLVANHALKLIIKIILEYRYCNVWFSGPGYLIFVAVAHFCYQEFGLLQFFFYEIFIKWKVFQWFHYH